MIAFAGLMGCATAVAADTDGFKDEFKYVSQRHWYVSNGWSNGSHQSCEWRADAMAATDHGLKLTLSDRGGQVRPIGCPELHTNDKFGYGLYETRMRTAEGSGLNTAFFTYVGPPYGGSEHDEIDFEFLGKDPHTVDLTYWTNGKATEHKVVQLGFDSSKEFHDYAFDWKPDSITWYVDGKQVFQSSAGKPQPHNPGVVAISLWSGSKEEDAWMGHFDYKTPATAEVTWAAYTPPDAACKFPESLKCKQK